MEWNDLIAPSEYNIVMEIEKYAEDKERIALKYADDLGKSMNLTYTELITNVNKVGNILLEHGLMKGDKLLVMVPRLVEV